MSLLITKFLLDELEAAQETITIQKLPPSKNKTIGTMSTNKSH